eukprot:gene11118-14922_t
MMLNVRNINVVSSFNKLIANVSYFSTKSNQAPQVFQAKQKNIKQSPLKMKFLVSLIRNCWVPDALAQLKFSPKHRAVDITKMLKRACAMAKLNLNAIPEELRVKEVMVTKGLQVKKMTIMGRGRTGFGYKRSSHVTVGVEKIDFHQMIAKAQDVFQKSKWQKRLALVEKLKSSSTIS